MKDGELQKTRWTNRFNVHVKDQSRDAQTVNILKKIMIMSQLHRTISFSLTVLS